MSAHEGSKPESPFFTMKEAAAYACCSVRTLERRIEKGGIHCYRIGRKRLIRRAELEAYLARADEDPAEGEE